MKKFNLSHKTHLLRISTIFCLLSSGLWVAPSHVHASLTGLQEYSVLSNEEQSYVTGGATADNQMVYPFQTDNLSLSVSKGDVSQTPSESSPSAPLQQEVTTTLTVNIISSPWATVDSNLQPSGDAGLPGVFVVEAVITNIGSTTATDVVVTLDYNEDPSSGWVLLAGEDPVRALDELAPGAAYYAYWFARYPNDARPEDILVPSHQYTVTAYAANASLVATSDNFYGNPASGRTVQIRSTQNTGSSGLIRTGAEIVGGVVLITVEYDLGKDPDDAIFSPVGNDDFDPGAYRLLASQVRFYDDGETQESVITDRLYFPTVPRLPDNSPPDKAEATFTFITVLPSSTTVCPYAAFNFSPNPKYDKNFCSARNGGVISITGTLTLSLTKQASSLTIEQGQSLTYTLHYTNNGYLPLSYGWIWDNVDINIGSIIATSVDPPSDPRQTSDSRVVWNLGTIPPDGTGTLTFAILIDGNGRDLADGTLAVNHAFFGVNPGSLAGKAALTSTVTTTVQAPTITLTKTDGRATAEPGDALMYTLRITNSGSIATSGLVITDELPAGVTLAGTTSPVFDSQSPDGQTLVWNSQDISADDTLVVTIPVTVNSDAPDGTILTNMATVIYKNTAGHTFTARTATDTTIVQTPVLTFTKTAEDVNGPPLVVSDTVRYTLQVTNMGTCIASDVTVTDNLPDQVTCQAVSGDSAPARCADPLVWNIPSLAADATASLYITVTINPGSEGQTITNTASVTGSNVYDPPDDPPPVCPDGSPEPCTPVSPLTTTLSISKSAEDVNGPPLVVSDTIRYTWQVTNTGTYTAYNVTVTDDLPGGVTYVYASADRGNAVHDSGTIRWTIASLPCTSNNMATLWITVEINADQEGQTITNTGSVTGSNVPNPPPPPPPVCPDGSPPNVNGVCPTTPVQSADLAVNKDVDEETPSEGDTIVYTIRVTNSGPSTATTVVLTDTLPTGVTYAAHSTSQGSYNSGSGRWDVGTLLNGSAATLTITATVNMGTGGSTIVNATDGPSADQVDPNSANNQGSASITINNDPGIIVVKEANVDMAGVGDTITYTYRVTNTGNVTLNSVTLSDDRLGPIPLDSDSLAPGAGTSGTATYEVEESDLPGPLTNTATVTGTPLVGGVVTHTDSESVELSTAVPGPNDIYLPIILRDY